MVLIASTVLLGGWAVVAQVRLSRILRARRGAFAVQGHVLEAQAMRNGWRPNTAAHEMVQASPGCNRGRL